jgi:hypothetical protein
MLNTNSVVFVHGLKGHPQHTWEYGDEHQFSIPQSKSKPTKHGHFWSFKPNPAGGFALADCSLQGNSGFGDVFWPLDKLPSDVPNARVWTYGYNADVISGLFQPSNMNSILQHGEDLMVKLERGLGNKARVSSGGS